MPAITLPLSFTNSFWSQDYRRGLETLFAKLEQGIAENEEIITFIAARATAEHNLAASLTNLPNGQRGKGFNADDGASLLMAFWGLKRESQAQGEAHQALANDLDKLVLEPFRQWAEQHAGRILDSRDKLLDGWLVTFEQSFTEVEKLEHAYLTKTRKADEAEDDAKFAPNNDLGDHYTVSSPRLNPRGVVANRTPSVSERIAERLKELRSDKRAPEAPPNPDKPIFDAGSEKDHEKESEDGDGDKTPVIDKGKGRATEQSASPINLSPPQMSQPLPPPLTTVVPPPPAPILLAGISFAPASLSALLEKARGELDLRAVRLPIIGEYPDCFTGEEFVAWLKNNVEAFGDSLDTAESAARELTEDENLLRRIGELGNEFEASSEAFYQFRPKAFTLHLDTLSSPVTKPPVAQDLLKRSGTLANFVIKQIKSGPGGVPPHVRARAEAQQADEEYRAGVRRLDRQRLALEDRIEETLKLLQRYETDRLRAVKTVLLQYHGTLSTLSSTIHPSLDRSSTLIQAYLPEADFTALIERYRTGPFRPTPQIYESITGATDVSFGVDLRKWAGEGGWAAVRAPEGEKKKDAVPPIVTSLLTALTKAYEKLPTDEEKRRAWIYEVPLPIVHHLREALNGLPTNDPVPIEFFEKCDAPVLAGVFKLWLLELNPPLLTWEGWDDVKKIYPLVGTNADISETQHIEDLQAALLRIPKVHLYVLGAYIQHIKELIAHTKSDEDLEVYLTKLSLSVGRTILRPRIENTISVQDRHHIRFFTDLVKHYEQIIPPTIEKKKKEADRPIQVRKRTALVDQRINRRSVQGFGSSDTKQLLEVREAQIASQQRPSRPTSPARATIAPPASSATSVSTPPTTTDPDIPPRPKFASPPPETDDSLSAPAAPLVVSPPTPVRARSPESPGTPNSPRSMTPTRQGHEDGSPVLSTGGASLARTGSAETSRIRGPRVAARGPRALLAGTGGAPSPSTAPTHGRVPSRSSLSDASRLRAGKVSPPPARTADPSEYAPKKRGGKTSAGAFSRRTMGSGSEEEVVGK